MNKWMSEIKNTTNTLLEGLHSKDEKETDKQRAGNQPSAGNTRNTGAESSTQGNRRHFSVDRLTPNESRNEKIAKNKSNKVWVVEPKTEKEAYALVNAIRSGDQSLLVKFEHVDESLKGVIVNILCGACYYAKIIPEEAAPNMLLIDPDLKQE